jgi:L-alanine-DL-glutamate epimerase-like enolase superfamily enzyme
MMNGATAKVEVFKIAIPLKEPFRIALGTMDQAQNLMVKVHATDGRYGIGEAAPIPYLTGESQDIAFEASRVLGRLLLGKDPYAIEERMRELNAALVHNSTAKSAFDMALYDLLGKRAGLPLYALLGGAKRPLDTVDTIGIDRPEIMAAKALDIQRRGLSAVKIKLGTSRAADVARLRAIREAVGWDIPIRVDANQGWDPVTAEAILENLREFDVQCCEQPVRAWNEEVLRRLRAKSAVPIMADESVFDHHDAFRLASHGACDYINIKLSKAGGIHAALKIVAVAESAGLQCMIGSMAETRLGLSAAAHLSSARPNIVFNDLDTAMMHALDPIVDGIRYEEGNIVLPDSPGIGADVEPGFLDQFESVTIE